MKNLINVMKFVTNTYSDKQITIRVTIQIGEDNEPDLLISNLVDSFKGKAIEIELSGEDFILSSKSSTGKDKPQLQEKKKDESLVINPAKLNVPDNIKNIMFMLQKRQTWTIKNLAELLNTNSYHIHKMINTGVFELEGGHIGHKHFRIKASSVIDYLNDNQCIETPQSHITPEIFDNLVQVHRHEIEETLRTPASTITVGRVAKVIEVPNRTLLKFMEKSGFYPIPQVSCTDPRAFTRTDFIKFIRTHLPDFMLSVSIGISN